MKFGPLFWIIGVIAVVGLTRSAPERAWQGGGMTLILAALAAAAVVAFVHNLTH